MVVFPNVHPAVTPDVGSLLKPGFRLRSEEHTSELQSRLHLVCRLLLEKKKTLSRHTSCHVGGPAEEVFNPPARAQRATILSTVPLHVPITCDVAGIHRLLLDGVLQVIR